MKHIMKMLTMICLVALTVVGCSRETVPPAAKGKILSTDGYSVDLKETGRYWLLWNEDMVILDTSTKALSQKVTVKMADDLDLTFYLKFRTRVHGNDKVVNMIFNDIKVDSRLYIPLEAVYDTYGRDVVGSVARTVMGKYKVPEVAKNYDVISKDIFNSVKVALENSPLEMSNIVVEDISWPKVVTDAIESRAERELAIETEANNQAVELVKRVNAIELVESDYAIAMKRAEIIRDENKLTAEGLNPILIQYRQLEVLEKLANNQNAVFVPYEALGSMGLNQRIFAK